MNFKNLIRKIIYPFCYAYYFLNKNKLNKSSDGDKLQRGISAVISMKDEEYTIGISILSLVDVVDQIICIDNGSEDNSINEVKKVIQLLKGKIDIELHEMPNALLGDCRNFGLSRTKYQWHLRWDADMIAIKSKNNDMRELRKMVLRMNKPGAVQFGYINLNGDFNHTVDLHKKSKGEPYLVFFNKDIYYQEIDKFDVIILPKYFKQINTKSHLFFHCGGLKSDKNLIHRFHYFTWRKFSINHRDFKISKTEFINKRNHYLFGTTDQKKVKYRYQKQNVHRFVVYNPETEIPYTKEIIEKLEKEGHRFEVVYRNGMPETRIDKNDLEMSQFDPSDEDLNWNIEQFFNKAERENYKMYIE